MRSWSFPQGNDASAPITPGQPLVTRTVMRAPCRGPGCPESLSALECFFLLARIVLCLSSCFEAHPSLAHLPELPSAPTDR